MEENTTEVKHEEKPQELPKKNKEGSFFPIIFVTGVSFIIAAFWDKLPFLKDTIHKVLDPSLGALLNLDLTLGMIGIVFLMVFISTIAQKYATDQKRIKELRDEQKELQKEMDNFKEHPEKRQEFLKKHHDLFMKMFKLNSRSILFTGIPFILFFRWFYDTFTAMGQPKFFGFLDWIWFYLIFTLIFSSILRKVMKVI